MEQCSENKECDSSTFCCSQNLCRSGDICIFGKKLTRDVCEYNYECLSRCCSSNKCSPINHCMIKCQKNSDCGAEEPCCSFGYCSGNNVICTQGMKVDYDMCESTSECQSQQCIHGRCTSSDLDITNVFNTNLMIGLMVFMTLILIATCCYV